jgi:shikimate kinase
MVMPFAERIYIVGFMGCGKTTAGRKLAARLEWEFIDLDREAERIAGMKIPEIFESRGEDFFRKTEQEALKALASSSHTVVSTGGGAPCHEDNMDHMVSSGITVYLKLTPAALRERLVKSKKKRPLLKGLDYEELLRFIERKLSEREKFYERAEIIIEGSDLDMDLLVSRIKDHGKDNSSQQAH